MKNKNAELLDRVAECTREFKRASDVIAVEAEQWAADRLEPFRRRLAEAMFKARDGGHSVTDIARSYTGAGVTPNRNAVYAILSEREEEADANPPFQWASRFAETANGTRVVYDVRADMTEFGPDRLWGTYVWRYDTSTHELDPVLSDLDPYPYESTFYRGVLDRWLENNPYPGEGAQ